MLTPRTFSEPQSNWALRLESGELYKSSAFRPYGVGDIDIRSRSTSEDDCECSGDLHHGNDGRGGW